MDEYENAEVVYRCGSCVWYRKVRNWYRERGHIPTRPHYEGMPIEKSIRIKSLGREF